MLFFAFVFWVPGPVKFYVLSFSFFISLFPSRSQVSVYFSFLLLFAGVSLCPFALSVYGAGVSLPDLSSFIFLMVQVLHFYLCCSYPVAAQVFHFLVLFHFLFMAQVFPCFPFLAL